MLSLLTFLSLAAATPGTGPDACMTAIDSSVAIVKAFDPSKANPAQLAAAKALLTSMQNLGTVLQDVQDEPIEPQRPATDPKGTNSVLPQQEAWLANEVLLEGRLGQACSSLEGNLTSYQSL